MMGRRFGALLAYSAPGAALRRASFVRRLDLMVAFRVGLLIEPGAHFQARIPLINGPTLEPLNGSRFMLARSSRGFSPVFDALMSYSRATTPKERSVIKFIFLGRSEFP